MGFTGRMRQQYLSTDGYAPLINLEVPMSVLMTDTTSTAQWQELVKAAEAHNHIQLDEDLESYLVFLLMRYTQKPEMAAKVMALEYLRGMQAGGSHRQAQLRDVGDQCLLYSGLFPQRAERRRVRISYYVDLGRSAYQSVADASQRAMAQVFSHLAIQFVELMDILLAMRELNGQVRASLDPLQSFELWSDTGSRHARTILGQHTAAMPVRIKRDTGSKH